MKIHFSPWAAVRVSTAQENHGNGRHLIRVRFRLRHLFNGAAAQQT